MKFHKKILPFASAIAMLGMSACDDSSNSSVPVDVSSADLDSYVGSVDAASGRYSERPRPCRYYSNDGGQPVSDQPGCTYPNSFPQASDEEDFDENENNRTANSTAPDSMSDNDQYALELLNQMRANPQQAANQLLNGQLNEGVSSSDQISTAPKQPLAWDLKVVAASTRHTQDMVRNNIFDHTGSDGSSSSQRVADAGYDWYGVAENIAIRTERGGKVTTPNTKLLNDQLFIDEGVAGRGHRTAMMNPSYEVVGITVGYSANHSALDDPSALITQNFARNPDMGPYLTGVAYQDSDNNSFYSPGEGLGGLKVTAFQKGTSTEVASTRTFRAGGYSLELKAGEYDITISGGLGDLNRSVTISNENVKLDYTQASFQ